MEPVTQDDFEMDIIATLGLAIPTKMDNILGIDGWLGEIAIQIKNQPAAVNTGNYAFEMELLAEGGMTMRGAFLQDFSEVVIMTPGDGWAHCFITAQLKQYVLMGKFRETTLSRRSVDVNMRQGRQFCDARIKLAPVAEIVNLAFLSFETKGAAILRDVLRDVIVREMEKDEN